MAEHSYGRIINILSPSAVLGFAMVSAYGTSKGALGSMTRVMAAELGPMGITVNSLTPGVSATENFVNIYSQFGVDLMSKGLPLGRACDDSDTKGALLLLASDEGSYITGANFCVDGGIIQFIVKDGKVQFSINVAAARRENLKISSRLLRLALAVYGNPSGEKP